MALMRDIFAAVRSGNPATIGHLPPAQPAQPAVTAHKVPIQTIDLQQEDEEEEEPKLWVPQETMKDTIDSLAFFKKADFDKLKKKEQKASRKNLFEWLDDNIEHIIMQEAAKIDRLFEQV